MSMNFSCVLRILCNAYRNNKFLISKKKLFSIIFSLNGGRYLRRNRHSLTRKYMVSAANKQKNSALVYCIVFFITFYHLLILIYISFTSLQVAIYYRYCYSISSYRGNPYFCIYTLVPFFNQNMKSICSNAYVLPYIFLNVHVRRMIVI